MINPTQLTAIVAAARAEDQRRAAARNRRPAPRSRRRAPIAALVALVLAAAGCGSTAVIHDPPPPPKPPVPPLPHAETFTREAPAIFNAISTFWTITLPAVAGVPYTPLADVVPYDPADPSTWPECGGTREGPAHNAFYCFTNNTLAYDRVWAQELYDRVGDAAVFTLVAHEIGHKLQRELHIEGRTWAMEVQADCFAGAALGWMRDNGALEVGDEREVADVLIAIADPRPDRAEQPDGHGNAQERITAFSLGFDGGAGGCIELLPPPSTGTDR